MGAAPAKRESSTSTKVALRIRALAHVDAANLDEGVVTKTTHLVVDAAIADELLQRHPYLEATEG